MLCTKLAKPLCLGFSELAWFQVPELKAPGQHCSQLHASSNHR